MILQDLSRAAAQMLDRRFLGVFAMGVALTVLLLAGFISGTVWLVTWLTPESITLPWIGEVGGVADWLSGGAGLLAALVLSAVLMVPVASAITGVFLDRIADAVEALHYPDLPPAQRASFGDALGDSLRFLGVIVGVNLLLLVVYLLINVLAPVLFWAVNGYLLGREYFHLVALRRHPGSRARSLRRANGFQVWLLGVAIAVPLTIPVLNLVVPILGVAAMTHLFHRVDQPPSR